MGTAALPRGEMRVAGAGERLQAREVGESWNAEGRVSLEQKLRNPPPDPSGVRVVMSRR